MTRRQRRMVMVLMLVGGVGLAVTLALQAFRNNLLYFISPSEVAAGKVQADRAFRLGGMVEKGTVHRKAGSLKVRFVLTDFAHTVPVVYDGVLPPLFKEGQGVIARGRINSHGVFVATEILAKHDAKYMPPNVADALKKGRAAARGASASKP
jgi:cytochrome c-type biogenesis protein CcmE